MTVAKPITAEGRCVINAGVALTAKHLQILKAWGIRSIYVEGDAGVTLEDRLLSDDDKSDKMIALNLRFSRCKQSDEFLAMLKRIALKQLGDAAFENGGDS